MKKYVMDQLSFILFFYTQLILIIVIAQIAATFSNSSLSNGILFYLFLLPTCFLIVFLLFNYAKVREFYQLEHTEESYIDFPEPTNNLLRNLHAQHDKQYSLHREKIEQLEQQKQLEIDFIQQWVHQMKTPISVMHLTMQKEKLNLPQSFADSMYEEMDRLQEGLNLAMYQSRLQKFDRDFHVEKIALRDIVKESIQDFKSSFIRNHVFPENKIDPKITVATDRKWFHFVLRQFISNAIKYSKDAGDKVIFEAIKDGQTTRLQIVDYGHGIPKQDQSRIFDPFFTGMNGRKFRESTGMGLYLSKMVCEELGHGIFVESTEGVGTTISVTFDQPAL